LNCCHREGTKWGPNTTRIDSINHLSTPEKKCTGGPEQESITTASKKAPDIGGLLAFGGLSPGWRRRE
jgi:hypothetical protein